MVIVVNFREVIGIIRTMFSKQSTTYEYNNSYYTSKITIGEMGTILNSYDSATYRRGFNLVRSIANQVGIGRIYRMIVTGKRNTRLCLGL